MAVNQGATVEQIVPYLNRLLKQAGMFDLPKDTNAGNVIDRLEVLFSQVDGYEKSLQKGQKATLGTAAGEPDVEVTLPPGVTMSSRLRPVTSKERNIQNRAAELARSRRISYFRALEICREIHG